MAREVRVAGVRIDPESEAGLRAQDGARGIAPGTCEEHGRRPPAGRLARGRRQLDHGDVTRESVPLDELGDDVGPSDVRWGALEELPPGALEALQMGL